MARVSVGDKAPNLVLRGHRGESIQLSDSWQKQPVVLFFYPKDGTPACTREACAFRDAYEAFVEAGAVVIGISGDSRERHEEFASSHRLPFTLVTDSGGEARRAWGVPRSFGVLPGRVTYVIDTQGVVRHIFNSQFNAEGHVHEALTALRRLGEA
jgi:peroxiredoxin Q/BCP